MRTPKRLSLCVAALFLIMNGAVVRAYADESPATEATQTPTPAPTAPPSESRGPFAISVGAAFLVAPGSSFSSTTSTQPAVGFEYGFPTSGKPGFPFVYLDLRSTVSPSVGAFGIGYSTESLTDERPYAGLGLSYSYVVKLGSGGPVLVPPCVDSCGVGGGSTSGLGGKVFVGFGFAPGLSLEASYDHAPQVQGLNPDAIGLQLKYRFK